MSDKINANAPGYDAATPEYFYEQRIAEMEKQLAERDAALARCVEAAGHYCEHKGCLSKGNAEAIRATLASPATSAQATAKEKEGK